MKIRTEAVALKHIAAAYNGVYNVVAKQIGATREVSVRDLRPYDLGDTTNTDYFTITYAATGWQTIYDTTVPSRKAFVIYGVSLPNATQTTSAIRITSGANRVRWIMLQELYDGSAHGRTVYFATDDQFIFQENTRILIEGYALSASTDYVVILGFVAEPLGETVYKPSKPLTSI